MIAMFTLGATPGFAGDTTATIASVEDSLTYVPTTLPTEPPMDEQIGGFISGAFGEELESMGAPIKGFSDISAKLLNSFRRVLNSLVKILQRIGLILGNSNIGTDKLF